MRDRGTSSLPAVVEGTGGGEHGAERSASGGRFRADRRGGRKGGLAEALGAEVRAEIDALVAPGAVGEQDFEAFEQAVRRKALAIAARAVEERLNADRSDHDGPAARCACGQTARYAGRRAKTFRSVLGPLRLERAWYHCGACRAGWSPRDRALGLQETSLSPGATRMVGLVAAEVSFARADELLGALAGVPIDAKQVERTAEALGREVAADERTVIEPPPGQTPPTMYPGLDGAGVPVRPSEVEGRRGKQPDDTARTREVKLAVVRTAEARDDEGRPVRDPGSARGLRADRRRLFVL